MCVKLYFVELMDNLIDAIHISNLYIPDSNNDFLEDLLI